MWVASDKKKSEQSTLQRRQDVFTPFLPEVISGKEVVTDFIRTSSNALRCRGWVTESKLFPQEFLEEKRIPFGRLCTRGSEPTARKIFDLIGSTASIFRNYFNTRYPEFLSQRPHSNQLLSKTVVFTEIETHREWAYHNVWTLRSWRAWNKKKSLEFWLRRFSRCYRIVGSY